MTLPWPLDKEPTMESSQQGEFQERVESPPCEHGSAVPIWVNFRLG